MLTPRKGLVSTTHACITTVQNLCIEFIYYPGQDSLNSLAYINACQPLCFMGTVIMKSRDFWFMDYAHVHPTSSSLDKGGQHCPTASHTYLLGHIFIVLRVQLFTWILMLSIVYLNKVHWLWTSFRNHVGYWGSESLASRSVCPGIVMPRQKLLPLVCACT